jgi:large subunit ribosomal protein L23
MKTAFDIINKLDMSFDQKASIDLVKYPLLTEKTIKLIEQNQYSFAVDANATKTSVKSAIEKLFGKKSQYKRAIVTLAPENSITLFEDV